MANAFKLQYQPIADAAAAQYGIPSNIFSAMIAQESSWNPTAQGQGTSAYGLGQLTKAAAAQVGANVYDPVSNLFGSAAYLAQMPGAASGDWATALAAYNQGPGGYLKGDGVAAGKSYARSVLGAAGSNGGPSVGGSADGLDASLSFMPDAGAAGVAGALGDAAGGLSGAGVAAAITGAGEKISGALGGVGEKMGAAGDAIAAPFKAVSDFFATLSQGFTGGFWDSAWQWIKDRLIIIAVLLLALVFLLTGGWKAVNAGAKA